MKQVPHPTAPSTLISALETIEARYRNESALAMDPLHLVKTFQDPWDREAIAWIAAHLA